MLEERLQNRNIKPTAMRLLVLKELIQSSAALSLKTLECRFEKADRATLYRTLKTFEQKKLIHSIEDGSGAIKYAICQDGCECAPQDQHIHFHCIKCDETYCLTQSKIPQTQIPARFRVSSASMVYQGLCANCD
jgi:Fur family ferric uptake transcriptional regulator